MSKTFEVKKYVAPPAADVKPAVLMQAKAFYDNLRKLNDLIQHMAHHDAEAPQVCLYCYIAGRPPIHVDSVAYDNPTTFVVFGTDAESGRNCAVLSHVHSVQLVFESVDSRDAAERRPIGFLGNVAEAYSK